MKLDHASPAMLQHGKTSMLESNERKFIGVVSENVIAGWLGRLVIRVFSVLVTWRTF